MSSSKRNGVSACRWLLLASTLLTTVDYVGGGTSSQCVQLGQTTKSVPIMNPTFTLGARNFTVMNIKYLGNSYEYDASRPETWPSNEATCDVRQDFFPIPKRKDKFPVDFCPETVDIKTYVVQQPGRTLRGWLHVVIDQMEFVYVQFRDEEFSPVGEFIVDPAHQCGNPDPANLVQPTQYQIYPCSATGAREEKTSTALFVARHDLYSKSTYLKENGRVDATDLKRGIYFTWRLSEYWCSRRERFRIDAQVKVVGKETLLRKVTDYWITPKWFGAADIVTGEEPLDCTQLAIHYDTGKVTNEGLAWISPQTTRLTFGNDYIHPQFTVNRSRSGCQLKVYDNNRQNTQGRNDGESIIPKFGGRCKDHWDKNPSINYAQECNRDETSLAFSLINLTIFQNYTDYKVQATQGRFNQCDQVCVHTDPTNETHLKEIQSFPKIPPPKPRVSLHTLLEARAISRDSMFWETRKFHGSLCVFVAIFLIPVSNFIARYYKETFMENVHTIPSWVWLHAPTGYVALTIFRCSYTAMRENINNWGTSTSTAAAVHRYLGYTFIVIFTVMSFLGGIRTVDPGIRFVTVIAHAVTGFVLYIMSIFLVIFSQNIPGSPSANCNEKTKEPEGFSGTATYALVWLSVDILFHIMMTTAQMMLDKVVKTKRPGGMSFVFIPMLQPRHQRNYPGAGFRRKALLFYVVASLTFTVLIIVNMYENENYANCTIGEMSCNISEDPFGCSTISKKYFQKVVTERYHVTNVKDFET